MLSFSLMNDAPFLLLSAQKMEEFFIDLLGDKSLPATLQQL